MSFTWPLLLFATANLFGQSAGTSQSPEDLYSEIFSAQLLVYNGHVYTKFPEPYDGSPIYGDDLWNEGSISYDNQVYKGIDLFYDTNQEVLVVEHFDKDGYPTYFSPNYERVDFFTLNDTKFIKISDSVAQANNIRSGYFQELFLDEIGMYAKRKTGLYKEQKQGKFIPTFKNEDTYYLKYQGTYFPIRTKGSIKKVLRDFKKQINQFDRQQNLLFFDDNREHSLLKIIQYCNALMKEDS